MNRFSMAATMVMYIACLDSKAQSEYSEVRARGDATNDVLAEISTYKVANKHRSTIFIDVFYVRATDPADFDMRTLYLNNHTNADWFFGHDFVSVPPYPTNSDARIYSQRGFFFEALNYSCGKVELLNSNGIAIKLIKPDINDEESYPVSFRFSDMAKYRKLSPYYSPNLNIYSGPPWPRALLFKRAKLQNFDVLEVFDIKEQGQYKLKVSPIIYRRSSKDADLCERVDLAPVCISILWNE